MHVSNIRCNGVKNFKGGKACLEQVVMLPDCMDHRRNVPRTVTASTEIIEHFHRGRAERRRMKETIQLGLKKGEIWARCCRERGVRAPRRGAAPAPRPGADASTSATAAPWPTPWPVDRCSPGTSHATRCNPPPPDAFPCSDGERAFRPSTCD
jgi:hypothetical protein